MRQDELMEPNFSVPKLSICMATFNRAKYIGETLDSILSQIVDGVEIVIVDGASTDDTREVVSGYVSRHANVRYFRESVNSGVDCDYDKAISYALGDYCWLMPDDDLMLPEALMEILSRIRDEADLIIVNSEVCDGGFKQVLLERRMAIFEDRLYDAGTIEDFFIEIGPQLTFIGCVVIRREVWLARNRRLYYGSLFIHVGVILQSPALSRILVIARPIISIRYGNAMWTSRSFEIWMFKWPEIIWSLDQFSDRAKSRVFSRKPWRNLRKLGMHRASGSFTRATYGKFFNGALDFPSRLLLRAVLLIHPAIANSLASIYCAFHLHTSRLSLLDLLQSQHSTWVTRLIFRLSTGKRPLWKR